MSINFKIAYFCFRVCEFSIENLVQVSESVQKHLMKLYQKYCTKEVIKKYQSAYTENDVKFMQNIINEVLREFNDDFYNVELVIYYSDEVYSIYENVDYADSPEYQFRRVAHKDSVEDIIESLDKYPIKDDDPFNSPNFTYRKSWRLLKWLVVKNYRIPSSKSINNPAFFNERSLESEGKPNYAELICCIEK